MENLVGHDGTNPMQGGRNKDLAASLKAPRTRSFEVFGTQRTPILNRYTINGRSGSRRA